MGRSACLREGEEGMSANSDLWALRDAIEHELEPAPEKEFVTTPYRAPSRGERPQRFTVKRPTRRKDHPIQPGEVTMKAFRESEALRLGLNETQVHNMIHRGQYPNLQIRRVNRRVVFVIPPKI